MQPCGLRDLACPRGRLSFGLKAGRVADYVRGTLAERGLKNIHATLRAAGFGAPLGATFVWPQGRAICGLRPRHLGRKGSKKTFIQPCGLRHLMHPQERQSFSLKAGRFAGYARSTLAQRALKSIHATLRATQLGASLGATVVWPQNQAICGLRPRHLGPKGLKKHSCNPAGCGIWRTLGGDFRLASRPGGLRATPAAPWPQGS